MAYNSVAVLGRDDVGLIAESDGFRYYLTECCFASAKGSMGGIVCRACYYEVDPALGGIPPERAIPEPFGDGVPYDMFVAVS